MLPEISEYFRKLPNTSGNSWKGFPLLFKCFECVDTSYSTYNDELLGIYVSKLSRLILKQIFAMMCVLL